jgi:chemotaxis protein CheX
MTPASAASAASGEPASWTPLLEEAAREVFELMLSSSLTKSAKVNQEVPGVTAMVGLAGRLCGLLSIRCSRKTAALMASKMLAMEMSEADDEVFDAFGEVGNMVAGNFKNKVPGLGDGCMLSVPTVVTGTDYSLHSTTAVPAIELHLLFETLPVSIALQISE